MATGNSAWARLTALNKTVSQPVLICSDQFVIGRAPDCDLVLTDASISSKHCKITRGKSGVITILDTSTNGTIVNRKKLSKKTCNLKHNQDIYLTANKDVGFLFCDLSVHESEVSETLPSTQVDGDISESEDDDGPGSAKKSKTAGEEDAFSPELTCSICQEIFYKPYGLQPCLHSFCGGCVSKWYRTSTACPICRVKVTQVAANVTLKNIVDGYLAAYPDKKRSSADFEEMDTDTKTVKEVNDFLSPGRRTRRTGGFVFPAVAAVPAAAADDDDDDDDDDGEDDDEPGIALAAARPPTPTIALAPFCRQCPGGDYTVGGAVAGPSRPPSFTCTRDTEHIICLCCIKPMPDRRTEPPHNGVPPQSCGACKKVFCNAYWVCENRRCTQCLKRVKDISDAALSAPDLICRNRSETRILWAYTNSRGMSKSDVRVIMFNNLDGGRADLCDVFGPTFDNSTFNSDSAICVGCSNKLFRHLLTDYRQSISMTELPARVRNRPDCHWGINCRTQSTNHQHAERFNHICPQTHH